MVRERESRRRAAPWPTRRALQVRSEAESRASKAEATAALAEQKAAAQSEQQSAKLSQLHEASAVSVAAQGSKAEAGEMQLRRLREEIASLRAAHAAELGARPAHLLHTSHPSTRRHPPPPPSSSTTSTATTPHPLGAGSAQERHDAALAAAQRQAAQEIAALDRSAQQGALLGGLAGQVQEAVGVVSKLQREVHSEHTQSWDQLQAWQQQRSEALAAQEARVKEREAGVAIERAKLADLTTAMQASISELRSRQEDESSRFAAEQGRLSRLQEDLERERAAAKLELATARQQLEAAREAAQLEARNSAAATESGKAQLAAELLAVQKERERQSREQASATTEAAKRGVRLRAEHAEVAAERALLEQAKEKVVAERQEVAIAHSALTAEREEFAAEVQALHELGLQVRAESAAVKEAMAASSAERRAAEELNAQAVSEKHAALDARAALEVKEREVLEQRRVFEQERLETAKERKALVLQQCAVSRSADATRTLQMQLVDQISAENVPPALAPPPAADPAPRAAARAEAFTAGYEKYHKPVAAPPVAPQPRRAAPRSPAPPEAGQVHEVGSPPRAPRERDLNASPGGLGASPPSSVSSSPGMSGKLTTWDRDYTAAKDELQKHQKLIDRLRAPPPAPPLPPAAARATCEAMPGAAAAPPPRAHPHAVRGLSCGGGAASCAPFGTPGSMASGARLSYQFPSFGLVETVRALPPLLSPARPPTGPIRARCAPRAALPVGERRHHAGRLLPPVHHTRRRRRRAAAAVVRPRPARLEPRRVERHGEPAQDAPLELGLLRHPVGRLVEPRAAARRRGAAAARACRAAGREPGGVSCGESRPQPAELQSMTRRSRKWPPLHPPPHTLTRSTSRHAGTRTADAGRSNREWSRTPSTSTHHTRTPHPAHSTPACETRIAAPSPAKTRSCRGCALPQP